MNHLPGPYRRELNTFEFLEVSHQIVPLRKYRIIKAGGRRVILHVDVQFGLEGEAITDVRTLLVPDFIPDHVDWIYRVARVGERPGPPAWAVAADENNNDVRRQARAEAAHDSDSSSAGSSGSQ